MQGLTEYILGFTGINQKHSFLKNIYWIGHNTVHNFFEICIKKDFLLKRSVIQIIYIISFLIYLNVL
jgi:hypothetical protein